MKLNPNCIRDILLKAEEIPSVHHHWDFNSKSIPSLFPQYTVDEVLYHLRQCDLNELFIHTSHGINYDYYCVGDLSPKGHEFLSNIRDNSLWKKMLQKGADASLPILMELAKQIASQYFLS